MIVVVFLIALGLVLGSFANALVWRLYEQAALREQITKLSAKLQAKSTKSGSKRLTKLQQELATLSMSRGRSMCSNCRHPLAPKDLVPFFSWLSLGGKCRYCRQPIQDPPILEAGLPVLFVLSYIFWPLNLQTTYGVVALVMWLVVLVGFLALTLYDFRWFLLPDVIVWPLAALALVQVVAHATIFGGGWQVAVTAFWGVVVCSGIFYLLYTVSQGKWIGGGDVKLGIVLGLLAGGPFSGILLIFTASLLGTLASLPALLRHQLKRTSVIPFGPFLMAAGVVVVLFGQAITTWFNDLLMLY